MTHTHKIVTSLRFFSSTFSFVDYFTGSGWDDILFELQGPVPGLKCATGGKRK